MSDEEKLAEVHERARRLCVDASIAGIRGYDLVARLYVEEADRVLDEIPDELLGLEVLKRATRI